MKKAVGEHHATTRHSRAGRAPDLSEVEEVVYVDDETFKRIQKWRKDPRYGEVPYESLYPGGDPEDFDAVIRPHAVDRELDQPVVYEVELRPRPSGKGVSRVKVPVKQSPTYREHLKRLSVLLAGGYEDLLVELERVTSPRKGRSLPPNSHYFWYDWHDFRPRYVRQFTQLTTLWLRSSPGEQRALAGRGERAIAKLTTRGPDHPRGRRRLDEPEIDPETLARLRSDVEILCPKARAIYARKQDGDGAGAERALAKLDQHETGRPLDLCRIRAKKLLKAAKRPRYIVNQLVAWKYGLRPGYVQERTKGLCDPRVVDQQVGKHFQNHPNQ